MRHFLAVALPPFVLLCTLTVCCYITAGVTLPLYLVGIGLAMALTPPLVLAHRDLIDRLLATASVVDGVGVVWLLAMFRSDVTFAQWLAAYVLLAACVIGVAGVAVFLSRYLMDGLFASATAALTALAWLTWPIWLSAWIDYPGVADSMQWLVSVHPLLALNGLLAHLGVWGELSLMYQLTSLGQDVPYSLPPSVALCAAAHALFGGTLLWIASIRHDSAAVDEPDRPAR